MTCCMNLIRVLLIIVVTCLLFVPLIKVVVCLILVLLALHTLGPIVDFLRNPFFKDWIDVWLIMNGALFSKQKEMLRDQVKQNGKKEGDLWPDRKGKQEPDSIRSSP